MRAVTTRAWASWNGCSSAAAGSGSARYLEAQGVPLTGYAGPEVGQARLMAAQNGSRITVAGRLQGGVDCDRLRPGRLVARRGGEEVSAPLALVAPCRVEGSIAVSESGRWFAYVEARDGARPLEAWIPVVMGSGQPAQVARTASLYVPT